MSNAIHGIYAAVSSSSSLLLRTQRHLSPVRVTRIFDAKIDGPNNSPPLHQASLRVNRRAGLTICSTLQLNFIPSDLIPWNVRPIITKFCSISLPGILSLAVLFAGAIR